MTEERKETKNCPFCGEEILKKAIKCRYCGEFLDESSENNMKNINKGDHNKSKKQDGNKPLTRNEKFFGQLGIFILLLIPSLSLCFFSRLSIFGVVIVCIRYTLCSINDNEMIDVKQYFKPERYKNKQRLIRGGVLTGFFFIISLIICISSYIKEKAIEQRKIDYAAAPIPDIILISQDGNIGDVSTYNFEALISGADTATINNEGIEIIDGKIKKAFNLDKPNLEIEVFAKNEFKSFKKKYSIERNKTEQEIEAEKIAKEEAERKAAEEAEKKAAEEAALKKMYAEKQKRIDQLKSRCRINYDEFKKIYWLEPKAIKNSNNQNAIEVYIGKYDDGSIIRRFKIMYAAKEWLFIKSYQFSIGGEVIDYKPTGRLERDNWTTIWERSDNFYGETENSIVQKIIANNGGKIRFNGSQYHDDREITQKEVNALKDMNELYNLLVEKQNLGY